MADVILKEEETIKVTLQEEEVIEVSLKEEEKPLDVELEDINYIPGYIAEEEKRRANEEERVAYYEDFKERVENGEFDGEDGPVYIAGENIEITEDNVINCTVKGGGGGGVSEEMDPTVPSYVKEITEEDINNWNNKSEFSGDYNDLINQPTIPTVPENVSAFKNDSGYLTEIPEEYVTTSELDGKGYLTEVPEGYVTDDDLDNYYTKEETESRLSEEYYSITADVNSIDNRLARLSSYVDEDSGLETEAKTVTGAINELKRNSASGGDYDSLPVGSVFDYDGDTVPEGYEEVEETSEINNPSLLFNASDLIYFTPVAGAVHDYYGKCYYYKVGTKVHIHLGLGGLPNVQANVFTLPIGYRPFHVLGGPCIGDTTTHVAGWEVMPTGAINVHTAYGYLLADIEFDAFG